MSTLHLALDQIAFAHRYTVGLLDDLQVGGEVFLGRAVLHELHGREEPFAASDVARVRVIAERRLETGVEPLAKADCEPLRFIRVEPGGKPV